MTEAPEVTRVAEPPAHCPRCWPRRSSWHPYILIPGAPAAGCGHCGYVVYLTQPLYGTRKHYEGTP